MAASLTRINVSAVLRLARTKLPRPLDVLNLVHLSDERSYARYGLAVAPALRAVGGKLLWIGQHETTLAGEPQAERLMVVRYPSHRRLLVMTMNPYYIAINRLRERGVRAFEASFTYADLQPVSLGDQRRLLVVHFNPPIALHHVREQIEPAAGPLMYASHEVAALSLLRGSRPSDPSPLTYKQVAFFAVDGASEPELPPLDGATISLYGRTDPRALLARAR